MQARYDGECGACGLRFAAGSEISKGAHGWGHGECVRPVKSSGGVTVLPDMTQGAYWADAAARSEKKLSGQAWRQRHAVGAGGKESVARAARRGGLSKAEYKARQQMGSRANGRRG